MASSNNLDALSQDAELPFGHPGRRSDDTPDYFDPSPLLDHGPEPDYTPDDVDAVVHYAPGDRPLCGSESMTRVYTDDPRQVGRLWGLPGARGGGPAGPHRTSAVAFTAGRRSPPRAERSGVGWFGGHARTAERRGGKNG